MANAKELHPNNQKLADLIDEHGLEKVMAATGYKISTLVQYMKGHCGVIPDTRLNIAIVVLNSNK